MLKYVKDVDENGSVSMIFLGSDEEYAKNNGFFLEDIEQGWDGGWYKVGMAPISLKLWEEEQARGKRNNLLQKTDVYLLPDYPISEENLVKIKEYRQALRDIPFQPGWPRNIVWPEKPIL